MEELLDQVDRCVTNQMNEALCSDFTSKEVVEALDSIGDFKARAWMVCIRFSTKNSGTWWERRSWRRSLEFSMEGQCLLIGMIHLLF